MSERNSSKSPHIRSKINTSGIMLAVIIALMPATGFGIYNFGLDVLYLILITVGTAVLTEYAAALILKRPISIGDYSAVVTGLLLALSLPPGAPMWIGAVGGIFAILVVKMLFGGLGQNFMNPAMAARAFLYISFISIMASNRTAARADESLTLWKTMFSYTGGAVGETSMIAIVIGAALLVILGVIDLKIPGAYIISFIVFIMLFTRSLEPAYLASYLHGGGLILGAFFMATDYTTRPMTAKSQIAYGIFLGFLTAIFRRTGSGIEGVAFAIIIGNLIVPLLDKAALSSIANIK